MERDEDMVKDGAAVLESEDGGIYCLSIIGQIEGHFALEAPHSKWCTRLL